MMVLLMLVEGSLEAKFPTYGEMQQQLCERSEKRRCHRRESQQKEDQRRERVREERVSRKKVNVRDKVDKSRNRVFSMSFVALGRKVASVKRWVRSHLVGGER